MTCKHFRETIEQMDPDYRVPEVVQSCAEHKDGCIKCAEWYGRYLENEKHGKPDQDAAEDGFQSLRSAAQRVYDFLDSHDESLPLHLHVELGNALRWHPKPYETGWEFYPKGCFHDQHSTEPHDWVYQGSEEEVKVWVACGCLRRKSQQGASRKPWEGRSGYPCVWCGTTKEFLDSKGWCGLCPNDPKAQKKAKETK